MQDMMRTPLEDGATKASRCWSGSIKPGWRTLLTFADPLHRVHLCPILHSMDGEVDLGEGLLLLYRADSIVDLASALIILGRGRLGLGAVGIHFEGGTAVYDELWDGRGGAIVSGKSAATFGEREKRRAGVWREGARPESMEMARLRSVGGEGG